jgi:hypothetical protein
MAKWRFFTYKYYTTYSLHGNHLTTLYFTTLHDYKFFFLSKSFYYFHNILKVLNFLCIKSQFHILKLDYIHKDLSLIYCNLVFIVRCENYYEWYIYYEIISGTWTTWENISYETLKSLDLNPWKILERKVFLILIP